MGWDWMGWDWRLEVGGLRVERGGFDGMGWDWMEMGLEVEGWKGGRKGVRPLDRWMDREVGKSEWNEGCFTLFCFG